MADLHEVRPAGVLADRALAAVRVARASPFPDDTGVVYLGGYDANDVPAHDTAWIAQGRLEFDARRP